ncbi:hypothetical protein [Nucisporomicrobium flavum]|uniref:hypothetical protein n=1 Tax=Nucisporomicrobium flavum TaxID=2785915 RepID=UPI0018F338E0|nr:hypothetical protein [Nucisporomicrobium flavum]
MELLNLTDIAARPIHTVAPGQLSLISIARILALEPDSYLLDDPFGSLDSLTRMQLSDELRRVHHHGSSTVLVTHDINEAVYLSHRVLVLSARPGTVLAEVVVDLPFPRTPSMRYSHTALETSARIKELLACGR